MFVKTLILGILVLITSLGIRMDKRMRDKESQILKNQEEIDNHYINQFKE